MLPETKNEILKIEDGVAYLKLTQGQVALVDVTDLALVGGYRWNAQRNNHGFYAKLRDKTQMHRVIMNPPEGKIVDHINGDGLDNRRANLRLATRSQNNWNMRQQQGSSKYKGVAYHKKTGMWSASIMVNKRAIHLGVHSTEEQAAYYYDNAAMHYHGEFACTNGFANKYGPWVVYQPKSGTSRYKGLYWNRYRNKWVVTIYANKRQIRIGQYPTEIQAAVAYNKAAIKLLGNKAKLNIIHKKAA